MWLVAVLWCYVEGVSTVKVAVRAATNLCSGCTRTNQTASNKWISTSYNRYGTSKRLGYEVMNIWNVKERVKKAWRKNTNKMQQHRWFIVNSRCWLLTTVSTCFGHFYAHHQEKRPRVTAYGVYLLVVLDVAGCGAVVLHWGCDHCEGFWNLHSDHTLSVAPQHRILPHPTLPANTLHMQ